MIVSRNAIGMFAFGKKAGANCKVKMTPPKNCIVTRLNKSASWAFMTLTSPDFDLRKRSVELKVKRNGIRFVFKNFEQVREFQKLIGKLLASLHSTVVELFFIVLRFFINF